MFILELTLRSWNHSEENKRRTLQRNDIAAAITRTDIFDFLVYLHFLPATSSHKCSIMSVFRRHSIHQSLCMELHPASAMEASRQLGASVCCIRDTR